MYSEKRKFGNIGEDIATKFFIAKGFKLLERNYLKKFGEIDLILKKADIVHFIEVKTVSRRTYRQTITDISRETYEPEENVTGFKLRKLFRTIECWILENEYDGEWQLDVMTVTIDPVAKSSSIKILPNIVL